MKSKTALHYYNKIKKGKKHSNESDVDQLWLRILNLYFLDKDDFTVTCQEGPRDEATMKTDVMVVRAEQAQVFKVVVLENKSAGFESQDGVWYKAMDQLKIYMMNSRMGHQPQIDMYAIITVGRFSRFYVLGIHKQQLEDYPGTNGRYFEFKDNEKDIDRILMEWLRKIRGW